MASTPKIERLDFIHNLGKPEDNSTFINASNSLALIESEMGKVFKSLSLPNFAVELFPFHFDVKTQKELSGYVTKVTSSGPQIRFMGFFLDLQSGFMYISRTRLNEFFPVLNFYTLITAVSGKNNPPHFVSTLENYKLGVYDLRTTFDRLVNAVSSYNRSASILSNYFSLETGVSAANGDLLAANLMYIWSFWATYKPPSSEIAVRLGFVDPEAFITQNRVLATNFKKNARFWDANIDRIDVPNDIFGGSVKPDDAKAQLVYGYFDNVSMGTFRTEAKEEVKRALGVLELLEESDKADLMVHVLDELDKEGKLQEVDYILAELGLPAILSAAQVKTLKMGMYSSQLPNFARSISGMSSGMDLQVAAGKSEYDRSDGMLYLASAFGRAFKKLRDMGIG